MARGSFGKRMMVRCKKNLTIYIPKEQKPILNFIAGHDYFCVRSNQHAKVYGEEYNYIFPLPRKEEEFNEYFIKNSHVKIKLPSTL